MERVNKLAWPSTIKETGEGGGRSLVRGKSLLSVATGEHCLHRVVVSVTLYIRVYVEIDSASWILRKLGRDASRCLAPANLPSFLFFFFYNLSNSFQGEPEIRFMRYVDT